MPRIPILIFLLISCTHCQSSPTQQNNRQLSEVAETNATCEQKCSGSELCIAECQRKMRETKQISLIIGLSSGIFLLLCAIVAIVVVSCLCPCMFCPCHFYQDVKRNINRMDVGSCTVERWCRQRKYLLQLLSLPSQQLQFTFKRGKQKYYSKITTKINKIEQQSYKTKIQFKGVDSIFGDWTAYGYILMKKKGIKLWFYKKYEVKKTPEGHEEQGDKKTESKSQKKKNLKIEEFTSKNNGLVFTSKAIDFNKGIIFGTWSLYHNYYKGEQFEETGTWEAKSMSDLSKIIERVEHGMPSSTSAITSNLE